MDEKDVVEVNVVEENPQDLPEEGKKKWWNKKRAIKVISISLVAVILLSVGIAYFAPKIHWYYLDQKYFDGKKPWTNKGITIILKKEYANMDFRDSLTVEDFEWDNIEKLEFKYYHYIDVYLKKQTEKEVKKAILHCRKLYFIEYAVWYSPSVAQPLW